MAPPTKAELEAELEALKNEKEARREAERRRLREYRRKQAERGQTPTSIWMDSEIKRQVTDAAEAEGRTLSAEGDRLLRAALDRPRPPAPVFKRTETPAAGPADAAELEPIRSAIDAGAEYPAAALGAWIEAERLRGRSFAEMAGDMNAAGIPTKRGREWSKQSLHSFFRRL